MSRFVFCLCLAGHFFFSLASAEEKSKTPKPNGNRLTYLDEPCNPYYVHRDFPKLTTPMWVGEEGVEAVVILGIDDMRGHEKWEAYLRPILNRLKQIDGRAPVSIMTCTIDPKHPHLQQWLEEGLSLEVHTVDHPCPLLKDGDLAKAKSTVDRCIDLLSEVPNNKPVCFRMPCCDSLNTLSPRFFTEIFAKTTDKGHFLQADSSVFNVFTSDDPNLPREVVLEEGQGEDKTQNTKDKSSPSAKRERFKKYIPADRFFANTIENYPYPYVIDRLCWEFPCVTPSDWSAQHLHKPHNPQTVEDWKAALDCTVIKQGVFCLVFHPHNWIKPEQINELIDHAVTKYGRKVKFLTFKDAVERLNKNVLGGHSFRSKTGDDAGLRLFDDANGFLGVWRRFPETLPHEPQFNGRSWNSSTQRWINNTAMPMLPKRNDLLGRRTHPNGIPLPIDPQDKRFRIVVRALNDDRNRELLLQPAGRGGVSQLFSRFDKELLFDALDPLFVTRPQKVALPLSDVGDSGLRFIHLDADGHSDLVFSDCEQYGIWLWESNGKGWWRELLSGQRRSPNDGLPPIVRADGSNNGFWVHSRNLVWMNEDTAKSKDLVERRSFDELLGRARRGSPDPAAKPTEGLPDPKQDSKSKEAKQPGDLRSDERRGQETRAERTDDGPKSPEESLKLMQVKPGYRVELVAAEPLVRDPVAFDWGPDGKLWVAEMADYPLGVGDGEEADNADAALPKSSPVAPRQESRRATDSPSPADSTTKANSRSADPVAERQGYKKGGGRVRILEDTDGDGKYDTSTVFLDKLNFPNGVMPWRDGVLISAAPDVLFARDTNGDGKADEVKVLLTGFGEGNQQHRVNGFSWGLDNMVHCANGDSGGQIKVVACLECGGSTPLSHATQSLSNSSSLSNPLPLKNTKEGNAKKESGSAAKESGVEPPHSKWVGKTIDIRGRDFRWNPDTGEIDPTSGQTQFGRNRDDFGNWFGNNNANPMYHFVLDDYYTRRNPHIAPPDPKKQVSVTPGPSSVFPISRTLARFNDFAMANRFTSANSAMVYRDELLFRSPVAPRQESRGETDSPSSADSPKKVDGRSAGPHAEREGYIQHVFISEPVHNLVHHEVMTADGVTFTSRRADDEQQSEFLASKDNWFRPTQIKTGPDGALYIADMYRQVIEHPQYIPPAMQGKLDLRAGHDKGRIYRVAPSQWRPNADFTWPANDTDDEVFVLSLFSANGTIRDLSHRILFWRHATRTPEKVVLLLRAIIGTTAERNQFASKQLHKWNLELVSLAKVHALSLLDGLESLSPADLSLAIQDPHPAVRRRALQAVENLAGELPPPLANQLSGMGRDPDPFVRMQFAYTLGHPKLASLGHELGKLLYRERDDKYLVAAAMSSIHAQNVASVVANVFESAGKEPLPPQLASTLLNLAATLGEDQALLSLIEYVLSGAATSESQPIMLATVLDTLGRRGTSLGQLKGIAPQRLARAEQQLAERIKTARTDISNFKSQISDLKSELLNLKSDAATASLPLLGRQSDRRGEDAKLVGELLAPQVPVPVQTAAVATLSRINDAESATVLLSAWRPFTPALRTQVLDVLLSRAAWTDRLLDALEAKSIAPSDVDAARRQRLVAHSNGVIRTRAAKLLEVSANADRQKLVVEFAAKLLDSSAAVNATRGAEVFKKRCATCHKLKDIGTSVGADLVSLTDKSTAALLTAILDPNKAVEAKFLAYSAVNKQGQLFSGMIAAETGNSITLLAADGKQHTLLRADLDEFVSSGKSFMPEGLEKDVSPSELADVIAFVQSSGPPPKKFDGNKPEAVTADAGGTLRLLATNAEIYGKTLVFEPQFKNLGYWGSVDDRAVWTINVTKPGKHSIRVNYACDNSTAGNEALFESAGQSVKAKIVGTGSWENYQTAILGELDLPAGQHRLTVRAAESLRNHLMDLREVRLQPE